MKMESESILAIIRCFFMVWSEATMWADEGVRLLLRLLTGVNEGGASRGSLFLSCGDVRGDVRGDMPLTPPPAADLGVLAAACRLESTGAVASTVRAATFLGALNMTICLSWLNMLLPCRGVVAVVAWA